MISHTLSRSAFRSALLALGALLLLAGCATRPSAEQVLLTATERTTHNLAIYDAAGRLVRDKYFDPDFRGVDWAAMQRYYRPAAAAAPDDTELYRTLNNLCARLKESHLTALPPRQNQEIRTARRMAVGMGWSVLEGHLVVTELIPASPADNAGVQLGWIITGCGNRPLDDGPPPTPQPGHPVTYAFLDLENKPHSITFQPQLLKFTHLTAQELPGGHVYLRFDKFDTESLRWLSQQLKAHRTAPGVVLDLRENRGGYMVAFQLAVGEFFNRRVATGQLIQRSGSSNQSHAHSFFSAHYAGRVVILTSGNTGSAAEIFAHVLQHEKRATVIGQRTAGAVMVSRTYRLPGGGALQVPIQDYRGLDGQRLEGRGVTPQLLVPRPSLTDLRTGHDPDLAAAYGALGLSPANSLLTAATQSSGPTTALR